MKYSDNILGLIGDTPLVKLNKMATKSRALILAKMEYMNPGGSVKDRIGIAMIRDAVKAGELKPGGTIIECTSGNTGMGLALAATVMGFKCIFTMPDKMSAEKINTLKAFGAEVITTPTAVAPDDPRSYYSVARKLSEEIPNSYYPNQYINPANPRAHYETTGPEIWRDTEGKITHFVAGLGTGGTISGTGKYLKEQNKDVRIIGADPIGSLYYDFHHRGIMSEAHSYLVEGIGEDIIPKTIDFSIIDDVIRVTDRDSFTTTRDMARQEGIFAGGSAGSAVWVALQVAKDLDENAVVVVLIPDSGSRYLSKVFNDQWLRDNQMLESSLKMTAAQIAAKKSDAPMELIRVTPDTRLADAVMEMKRNGISQVPVLEGTDVVGSLREGDIIEILVSNPEARNSIVREVMSDPFAVIAPETSFDELTRMLAGSNPPVMLRQRNGSYDIITKSDLMHAIV